MYTARLHWKNDMPNIPWTSDDIVLRVTTAPFLLQYRRLLFFFFFSLIPALVLWKVKTCTDLAYPRLKRGPTYRA